jgi:hypothetical protein
MDKRYQGVIRRRKSMKDRQDNGLKIPRVIRRHISMKDRKTMDKGYQGVIRSVLSVLH